VAILKANEPLFEKVKEELTSQWRSAAAAAQFYDDPDSYAILSRAELNRILQGC
jgi:hypothetical protein